MKKIININLSGRVLPIEETAYEQLQSYISSLRKHFAHEESRDEIINDIEGRIAEILYDKVQRGVPCITDEHVLEVIAAMGRPEELTEESVSIGADAKNNAKSGSSIPHYANKDEKRFYRDANNRILGGVASGIANYLNIDPAIIRAVFVLMALSSLGFFMLGYVLVWILVPAKELERYQGKRFYRNPDDRIFGGVASGLAAYFNRPVRNIRLIFLSPILLQVLLSLFNVFDDSVSAEILFNISLGSFTGFSILLYIVLWIILPTANTPYQKMEMRGERVDAERIRRHVNEGAEFVKEKMKDFGQEVNQAAGRISEKAEQFAAEAQKRDNIFVRFIRAIFRGIGLLFKIFFSVLFGGIAFVLLVVFAALLFGGIVSWPLQNFIWSSNWQQWLAWSAFALFFMVPIIGFLIWLIRRLIGVREKKSYLGWTFGGLWALGWVALILFLSSVAKDFRYQEKIKTEIALDNPGLLGMYVTVSQPELTYSKSFSWIEGDGRGWDLTPDTLRLSNVNIKFEASTDTLYHVQLIRSASGKTMKIANERAESITYPVYSSTASGNYSIVQYSRTGDTLQVDKKGFQRILLDLGNGYSIPANSKYRVQQVMVLIRVPVGKTIAFDESLRTKLHQGELLIHRNRSGKLKGMEWEQHAFYYETGVEYIMTPGGELKRTDGKPEAPQSVEQNAAGNPESASMPASSSSAISPIAPTAPTPLKSACQRSITPSPLNTLLWG